MLAPSLASAQTSDCANPNVLMLFDSSGSMKNPTSNPKFDQAVGAVTATTDALDDQIRFGLSIFPNRQTRGCSITPEPDVGFALNNGAKITNLLSPSGSNYYGGPAGATPIYQALGAASDLEELHDPARRSYVVLITDGTQLCCGSGDYDNDFDCLPGVWKPEPVEEAENIQDLKGRVEQLVGEGIHVFVVGLSSGVSAQALNTMAVAGQTAKEGCNPDQTDPAAADNCYYFADSEADLQSALQSIAQIIGAEQCDGIDNDCDGQIDEDFSTLGQACDSDDADLCKDGTVACSPLKTGTVCLEPGDAKAELCNELDDDCDGEVDEDFGTLGVACDGADADQCTSGTYICSANGGSVVCSETGDGNVEICNSLDDDCDGTVDEGFTGMGDTCDSDDADFCADGKYGCSADGSKVECLEPASTNKTESCNGIDDDCDGTVDDGNLCPEGEGCENGKCTPGEEDIPDPPDPPTPPDPPPPEPPLPPDPPVPPEPDPDPVLGCPDGYICYHSHCLTQCPTDCPDGGCPECEENEACVQQTKLCLKATATVNIAGLDFEGTVCWPRLPDGSLGKPTISGRITIQIPGLGPVTLEGEYDTIENAVDGSITTRLCSAVSAEFALFPDGAPLSVFGTACATGIGPDGRCELEGTCGVACAQGEVCVGDACVKEGTCVACTAGKVCVEQGIYLETVTLTATFELPPLGVITATFQYHGENEDGERVWMATADVSGPIDVLDLGILKLSALQVDLTFVQTADDPAKPKRLEAQMGLTVEVVGMLPATVLDSGRLVYSFDGTLKTPRLPKLRAPSWGGVSRFRLPNVDLSLPNIQFPKGTLPKLGKLRLPSGAFALPNGTFSLPKFSFPNIDFVQAGTFKLPQLPSMDFSVGSWSLPDAPDFGLPEGIALFPDGSLKLNGKLYWDFRTALKLPEWAGFPDGVFALPDGSLLVDPGKFTVPWGSLPEGSIVLPSFDKLKFPTPDFQWTGWDIPTGGILLPAGFQLPEALEADFPDILGWDLGGAILLPNGNILRIDGSLFTWDGVEFTLTFPEIELPEGCPSGSGSWLVSFGVPETISPFGVEEQVELALGGAQDELGKLTGLELDIRSAGCGGVGIGMAGKWDIPFPSADNPLALYVGGKLNTAEKFLSVEAGIQKGKSWQPMLDLGVDLTIESLNGSFQRWGNYNDTGLWRVQGHVDVAIGGSNSTDPNKGFELVSGQVWLKGSLSADITIDQAAEPGMSNKIEGIFAIAGTIFVEPVGFVTVSGTYEHGADPKLTVEGKTVLEFPGNVKVSADIKVIITKDGATKTITLDSLAFAASAEVEPFGQMDLSGQYGTIFECQLEGGCTDSCTVGTTCTLGNCLPTCPVDCVDCPTECDDGAACVGQKKLCLQGELDVQVGGFTLTGEVCWNRTPEGKLADPTVFVSFEIEIPGVGPVKITGEYEKVKNPADGSITAKVCGGLSAAFQVFPEGEPLTVTGEACATGIGKDGACETTVAANLCAGGCAATEVCVQGATPAEGVCKKAGDCLACGAGTACVDPPIVLGSADLTATFVLPPLGEVKGTFAYQGANDDGEILWTSLITMSGPIDVLDLGFVTLSALSVDLRFVQTAEKPRKPKFLQAQLMIDVAITDLLPTTTLDTGTLTYSFDGRLRAPALPQLALPKWSLGKFKLPNLDVSLPHLTMPKGTIPKFGKFQLPNGAFALPNGGISLPDFSFPSSAFLPTGNFSLPEFPNISFGVDGWKIPGSFGLPKGAFMFPDGLIKIDGKIFWSPKLALKLPDWLSLPEGLFALPDGRLLVDLTKWKIPLGSLPLGSIALPKFDGLKMPAGLAFKGWDLPEGGILLPAGFNLDLPGIGSFDLSLGILLPNGNINLWDGRLLEFQSPIYVLKTPEIPTPCPPGANSWMLDMTLPEPLGIGTPPFVEIKNLRVDMRGSGCAVGIGVSGDWDIAFPSQANQLELFTSGRIDTAKNAELQVALRDGSEWKPMADIGSDLTFTTLSGRIEREANYAETGKWRLSGRIEAAIGGDDDKGFELVAGTVWLKGRLMADVTADQAPTPKWEGTFEVEGTIHVEPVGFVSVSGTYVHGPTPSLTLSGKTVLEFPAGITVSAEVTAKLGKDLTTQKIKLISLEFSATAIVDPFGEATFSGQYGLVQECKTPTDCDAGTCPPDMSCTNKGCLENCPTDCPECPECVAAQACVQSTKLCLQAETQVQLAGTSFTGEVCWTRTPEGKLGLPEVGGKMTIEIPGIGEVVLSGLYESNQDPATGDITNQLCSAVDADFDLFPNGKTIHVAGEACVTGLGPDGICQQPCALPCAAGEVCVQPDGQAAACVKEGKCGICPLGRVCQERPLKLTTAKVSSDFELPPLGTVHGEFTYEGGEGDERTWTALVSASGPIDIGGLLSFKAISLTLTFVQNAGPPVTPKYLSASLSLELQVPGLLDSWQLVDTGTLTYSFDGKLRLPSLPKLTTPKWQSGLFKLPDLDLSLPQFTLPKGTIPKLGRFKLPSGAFILPNGSLELPKFSFPTGAMVPGGEFKLPQLPDMDFSTGKWTLPSEFDFPTGVSIDQLTGNLVFDSDEEDATIYWSWRAAFDVPAWVALPSGTFILPDGDLLVNTKIFKVPLGALPKGSIAIPRPHPTLPIPDGIAWPGWDIGDLPDGGILLPFGTIANLTGIGDGIDISGAILLPDGDLRLPDGSFYNWEPPNYVLFTPTIPSPCPGGDNSWTLDISMPDDVVFGFGGGADSPVKLSKLRVDLRGGACGGALGVSGDWDVAFPDAANPLKLFTSGSIATNKSFSIAAGLREGEVWRPLAGLSPDLQVDSLRGSFSRDTDFESSGKWRVDGLIEGQITGKDDPEKGFQIVQGAAWLKGSIFAEVWRGQDDLKWSGNFRIRGTIFVQPVGSLSVTGTFNQATNTLVLDGQVVLDFPNDVHVTAGVQITIFKNAQGKSEVKIVQFDADAPVDPWANVHFQGKYGKFSQCSDPLDCVCETGNVCVDAAGAGVGTCKETCPADCVQSGDCVSCPDPQVCNRETKLCLKAQVAIQVGGLDFVGEVCWPHDPAVGYGTPEVFGSLTIDIPALGPITISGKYESITNDATGDITTQICAGVDTDFAFFPDPAPPVAVTGKACVYGVGPDGRCEPACALTCGAGQVCAKTATAPQGECVKAGTCGTCANGKVCVDQPFKLGMAEVSGQFQLEPFGLVDVTFQFFGPPLDGLDPTNTWHGEVKLSGPLDILDLGLVTLSAIDIDLTYTQWTAPAKCQGGNAPCPKGISGRFAMLLEIDGLLDQPIKLDIGDVNYSLDGTLIVPSLPKLPTPKWAGASIKLPGLDLTAPRLSLPKGTFPKFGGYKLPSGAILLPNGSFSMPQFSFPDRNFVPSGSFKPPQFPSFSGGKWTLPDDLALSMGLPKGIQLDSLTGDLFFSGKKYWSIRDTWKLAGFGDVELGGVKLPAGLFTLPDGSLAINTSLFKTPWGVLPAGAIAIPDVDLTVITGYKGWDLPEGGILLPNGFSVALPGITGQIDLSGALAMPNGDIKLWNGDLYKYLGTTYQFQPEGLVADVGCPAGVGSWLIEFPIPLSQAVEFGSAVSLSNVLIDMRSAGCGGAGVGMSGDWDIDFPSEDEPLKLATSGRVSVFKNAQGTLDKEFFLRANLRENQTWAPLKPLGIQGLEFTSLGGRVERFANFNNTGKWRLEADIEAAIGSDAPDDKGFEVVNGVVWIKGSVAARMWRNQPEPNANSKWEGSFTVGGTIYVEPVGYLSVTGTYLHTTPAKLTLSGKTALQFPGGISIAGSVTAELIKDPVTQKTRLESLDFTVTGKVDAFGDAELTFTGSYKGVCKALAPATVSCPDPTEVADGGRCIKTGSCNGPCGAGETCVSRLCVSNKTDIAVPGAVDAKFVAQLCFEKTSTGLTTPSIEGKIQISIPGLGNITLGGVYDDAKQSICLLGQVKPDKVKDWIPIPGVTLYGAFAETCLVKNATTGKTELTKLTLGAPATFGSGQQAVTLLFTFEYTPSGQMSGTVEMAKLCCDGGAAQCKAIDGEWGLTCTGKQIWTPFFGTGISGIEDLTLDEALGTLTRYADGNVELLIKAGLATSNLSVFGVMDIADAFVTVRASTANGFAFGVGGQFEFDMLDEQIVVVVEAAVSCSGGCSLKFTGTVSGKDANGNAKPLDPFGSVLGKGVFLLDGMTVDVNVGTDGLSFGFATCAILNIDALSVTATVPVAGYGQLGSKPGFLFTAAMCHLKTGALGPLPPIEIGEAPAGASCNPASSSGFGCDSPPLTVVLSTENYFKQDIPAKYWPGPKFDAAGVKRGIALLAIAKAPQGMLDLVDKTQSLDPTADFFFQVSDKGFEFKAGLNFQWQIIKPEMNVPTLRSMTFKTLFAEVKVYSVPVVSFGGEIEFIPDSELVLFGEKVFDSIPAQAQGPPILGVAKLNIDASGSIGGEIYLNGVWYEPLWFPDVAVMNPGLALRLNVSSGVPVPDLVGINGDVFWNKDEVEWPPMCAYDTTTKCGNGDPCPNGESCFNYECVECIDYRNVPSFAPSALARIGGTFFFDKNVSASGFFNIPMTPLILRFDLENLKFSDFFKITRTLAKGMKRGLTFVSKLLNLGNVLPIPMPIGCSGDNCCGKELQCLMPDGKIDASIMDDIGFDLEIDAVKFYLSTHDTQLFGINFTAGLRATLDVKLKPEPGQTCGNDDNCDGLTCDKEKGAPTGICKRTFFFDAALSSKGISLEARTNPIKINVGDGGILIAGDPFAQYVDLSNGHVQVPPHTNLLSPTHRTVEGWLRDNAFKTGSQYEVFTKLGSGVSDGYRVEIGNKATVCKMTYDDCKPPVACAKHTCEGKPGIPAACGPELPACDLGECINERCTVVGPCFGDNPATPRDENDDQTIISLAEGDDDFDHVKLATDCAEQVFTPPSPPSADFPPAAPMASCLQDATQQKNAAGVVAARMTQACGECYADFTICEDMGRVRVVIPQAGGAQRIIETEPVVHENQWQHIAVNFGDSKDSSSKDVVIYINGETADVTDTAEVVDCSALCLPPECQAKCDANPVGKLCQECVLATLPTYEKAPCDACKAKQAVSVAPVLPTQPSNGSLVMGQGLQRIDDVRLWNFTRTQEQLAGNAKVLPIFQTPFFADQTLIARYEFDWDKTDKTGTTAYNTRYYGNCAPQYELGCVDTTTGPQRLHGSYSGQARALESLANNDLFFKFQFGMTPSSFLDSGLWLRGGVKIEPPTPINLIYPDIQFGVEVALSKDEAKGKLHLKEMDFLKLGPCGAFGIDFCLGKFMLTGYGPNGIKDGIDDGVFFATDLRAKPAPEWQGSARLVFELPNGTQQDLVKIETEFRCPPGVAGAGGCSKVEEYRAKFYAGADLTLPIPIDGFDDIGIQGSFDFFKCGKNDSAPDSWEELGKELSGLLNSGQSFPLSCNSLSAWAIIIKGKLNVVLMELKGLVTVSSEFIAVKVDAGFGLDSLMGAEGSDGWFIPKAQLDVSVGAMVQYDPFQFTMKAGINLDFDGGIIKVANAGAELLVGLGTENKFRFLAPGNGASGMELDVASIITIDQAFLRICFADGSDALAEVCAPHMAGNYPSEFAFIGASFANNPQGVAFGGRLRLLAGIMEFKLAGVLAESYFLLRADGNVKILDTNIVKGKVQLEYCGSGAATCSQGNGKVGAFLDITEVNILDGTITGFLKGSIQKVGSGYEFDLKGEANLSVFGIDLVNGKFELSLKGGQFKFYVELTLKPLGAKLSATINAGKVNSIALKGSLPEINLAGLFVLKQIILELEVGSAGVKVKIQAGIAFNLGIIKINADVKGHFNSLSDFSLEIQGELNVPLFSLITVKVGGKFSNSGIALNGDFSVLGILNANDISFEIDYGKGVRATGTISIKFGKWTLASAGFGLTTGGMPSFNLSDCGKSNMTGFGACGILDVWIVKIKVFVNISSSKVQFEGTASAGTDQVFENEVVKQVVETITKTLDSILNLLTGWARSDCTCTSEACPCFGGCCFCVGYKCSKNVFKEIVETITKAFGVNIILTVYGSVSSSSTSIGIKAKFEAKIFGVTFGPSVNCSVGSGAKCCASFSPFGSLCVSL